MEFSQLFLLRKAICILAIAGVAGCTSFAGGQESTTTAAGDYTAGAIIDDAETASLINWNSNQYLLSINSKQQVVLNNIGRSTEHTILSSVEDDGAVKRLYPSGVVDGEKLHAVWMEKNTKPKATKEKTGDKFIIHAALLTGKNEEPKLQRISNGGGAFVPIIKTSKDGKIFVVWVDERRGGAFDIYVNASRDGGKNWLPEEFHLTNDVHPFVIDPTIEIVGNSVVVAWVQQKSKNVFSVLSRTSNDFGSSWSSPSIVYEDSNQPITPKLLHTKEGLNACWAMATGVACAGSKDNGYSWDKWSLIEGSERTGLLSIKSDSKGLIHVITNQRSEDGKSAALFYSNGSAFQGFLKVRPISREPLFNTKSIAPSFAVGPRDELMVAWMDFHFMKPLIAATASNDGGKTWLKPYIVSYFGKTDHQYFPYITIDSENVFDLVYLSEGVGKNDWTTIQGAVDVPRNTYDPKIDVSSLKYRALQYWETRLKSDWSKSYDFMDPYYRKVVKKETYVATQGRVNYFSYEIKGEPQLNGVKASIPIEYESEVPEFMIKGKMVKVPKQKTVYQQNWVWMDGQWYVVFEDVMGNTSLPN